MSNYYFVGTALPDLQIGMPPEITLEELAFMLKLNLTTSDLAKVNVIRKYFDLENIRSFWTGRELDVWGTFDQNTLEEALLTKIGLPGYVYDFMQKYDSIEERLKHFSGLLAKFYQEEIDQNDGFLKDLLIVERNVRLVLAALRVKKYGRDLLLEMQYENPEDPLVGQIIAQKDSPSYDPPAKYEALKTLFETYSDNPLELHKAILEFRFRQIQELIGLQTFTLDRILAYMFQLILAEKWVLLDQHKGQQIINTIIQDVA